MLESYVERRISSVSANSASNDVRAFRSFYKFLVEDEEIDVDPARRPSRPSREGDGKSSTTTRSVSAWAAICRSISVCIAGWTMAFRSASASLGRWSLE